MNDAPLRLVGLRGATTCPANTATDIRHAASELIDALVSRNGIKPGYCVFATLRHRRSRCLFSRCRSAPVKVGTAWPC